MNVQFMSNIIRKAVVAKELGDTVTPTSTMKGSYEEVAGFTIRYNDGRHSEVSFIADLNSEYNKYLTFEITAHHKDGSVRQRKRLDYDYTMYSGEAKFYEIVNDIKKRLKL